MKEKQVIGKHKLIIMVDIFGYFLFQLILVLYKEVHQQNILLVHLMD